MKKLLLVVVLFVAAVSCVQAQDVYQWFGGEPANSDWNYGMNWKTEYCAANPAQNGTFGTVPDAFAKTKHNNVLWGSVASVVVDEAVSVGDIFMVDAGWLSPEDVTVAAGGVLTVQGATTAAGDAQINIAYAAPGVASLIMDGGTADVDGIVHIGWGGNGSLILNSGTITVNAIDMAANAGATGTMAITEGKLVIRDWVEEQIALYIANGWITGYGSAENVVVEYDEIANTTTVSAIPEPITLSLLSLGALLLRKRS